MIARAAIGNPWIFSRLDRVDVPVDLLRRTMLDHLSRMLSFYGPQRGLVLFRKYAARYLSPYRLEGPIRQALMTSSRQADFLAILDQVLHTMPIPNNPELSLYPTGSFPDNQAAF